MDEQGPLGSMPRSRKLLHIAFWTALFYVLAAGIGKFVEWLDTH